MTRQAFTLAVKFRREMSGLNVVMEYRTMASSVRALIISLLYLKLLHTNKRASNCTVAKPVFPKEDALRFTNIASLFAQTGSTKEVETKKVDWEEEFQRLERQLENYRHVVEQQESLIEVNLFEICFSIF